MKLLFVILSVLPFSLLAKDSLSEYSVKILEPLDQRVVVKLPDGEMKVFKPGDKLGDSNAEVSEVLQDKLVLKQIVTHKNGDKEKQTVLMFKENNGKSKIERLYVLHPKEN